MEYLTLFPLQRGGHGDSGKLSNLPEVTQQREGVEPCSVWLPSLCLQPQQEEAHCAKGRNKCLLGVLVEACLIPTVFSESHCSVSP